MAMTALVIRPITVVDEAEWRRLWRGYLDFYGVELPETLYARNFARLCDPAADDYRGLVAVLNDATVGLAHVILHFHGWKSAPAAYLQDLYVDPRARGVGVGQALIEAVYAMADEADAPDVYWLTQDFNATARRLYDRVATVTPFIKYQR